MADVAPLPVNGTVVLDTRDAGRNLRVSWHQDLGVFVVSLWRDDACIGTVHLAPSAAADVVTAFVDGLATTTSAGGRQTA